MPGTYHKILLHVVFSTKKRVAVIKPEIRDRLYAYVGGIVRAEKGVLYEIGGIPDHVHLLIRWRTDESIATLMRTAKSRSSAWVHATFPAFDGFAWQEGYGAFSVSESQVAVVREYIARQEEHHRSRTFEEELVALLKAHDVEYDPKIGSRGSLRSPLATVRRPFGAEGRFPLH